MAPKKKGSTLEYDDVLKYVLGDFGKYQIYCFWLLVITAIPSGIQAFAMVFTMAETDSWCRVPDVGNISPQVCVSNLTADCMDLVKNLTIPKEPSLDSCEGGWKYSQCYRYNISSHEITYSVSNSLEGVSSNVIKCDHGWEYDRSQYKETVSQKFDLVCDRYHLNALLPSIAFVGSLIGSVCAGIFLDKFGRLRGLILSVALLEIFGIVMIFSPNYAMFAVCNCLLFAVVYSIYLAGFVLVTEHVGPSKRPLAGNLVAVFYSVGYILISVFAYFIREWWKLQLAITIPNAIFLIYWCLIDESPRWLLSVGKVEEAEKIIRKSARINKVDVPDDLFDESWKPEGSMNGNIEQKKVMVEDEEIPPGILTLFKLPNLRKEMLILMSNFVANSIVYFGLNLNTSSLGGSDYLNAFISAAVEIPAYLIATYLMEVPFLGRRLSLFATMILSGCGTIAAAFVPPCGELTWLRVTLAMIGKYGISSSFAIVFIYVAELIPTPVRSMGVGICSTSAFIGAIVSPQVLLLKTFWAPLPPVIFGVASILAGIMVLPLPETRGKKLPETMAEGERFGQKRNHRDYKGGYGEIRKVEINDNCLDTDGGVHVELVDM
ncbi:organic cation transporter protein-like [Ptychodera flava]|uniref:organic cation transporter protein-like n=1 Tax=Ptychodera flava TaxID=63121 RepID=UPI00396A4C39